MAFESLNWSDIKDLVQLRQIPEINHPKRWSDACRDLPLDEVVRCYRYQYQHAPNRLRDARNGRFFVGHSGKPSSGPTSNRREEHLAIALCAVCKNNWRFQFQ